MDVEGQREKREGCVCAGRGYGTNKGVEAGIGVLPRFSHFLFLVLLLFLSCFQGRGWEDQI